MTRLLLITTAVIEVSTGVALLLVPSLVTWLLLGEEVSDGPTIVVGRIMGAALLSIGVACWQSRNGEQNERRNLVGSTLIYNLTVPAVLSWTAIANGIHGIALWPACIVHLVLAFVSIRCLQSNC